MTSKTDRSVQIIDHLVLPAVEVEAWLGRWRTAYLPGAHDRGMRHVATSQQFAGPATVAVRVAWELPGPYALYGMRGAAAADPTVAQFWAETDRLAIVRDRSVAALEEHR